MRYCVSLSYSGAGFCGWQVQPGSPSVQGELEKALSTLLQAPVEVTGAGRTDTGVNALRYVAHFDFPTELPFGAADFCYKLNAILPHSIAVLGVSPAAPDFHARFNARRREYTYFIHRVKDPFMDSYSWQCGYPALDFDAMNLAASFLPGTRDFSCFQKTGGSAKTSVCTVFEAFWAPYTPSHLAVMPPSGATRFFGGEHRLGMTQDPSAPPYWYFRISADRFLRNMVRAVVGTLIEVGRGRRSPDSIPGLLASGSRSDAGESVPGKALFLSNVLY